MTLWIFDPGHSGEVFGHYLTAGKRSPQVAPGVGVYEGAFNRAVCARLVELCAEIDIDAVVTNPGPIAIPLAMRKEFIREMCKVRPCAVMSVHCNASGNVWDDKAHGSVTFVSKRNGPHVDRSLELAYLIEKYSPRASRGIKRANFAMVTGLPCPAVLTEVEFMTHPQGAAWLASPHGIEQAARSRFRAIVAMGA